MLSVTLTDATKGRIRCEAKRDDAPVLLETFPLDSSRSRDAVAKKIGVDAPTFLAHCTSLPASFTVDEATLPTLDQFTAHVRDMRSTDAVSESGDPAQVIYAALTAKTSLADPIVEWTDDTAACFLDVDYHHIPELDERPTAPRLAFLVSRIQPQPVLWFVSRGRGLHALYTRRDSVPANVLAAVAGFSYHTLDPIATYDIVPRSRLAGGEVHRCEPSVDMLAVSRFLRGAVSSRDVEDYIDRRGVVLNTAYVHTHCPVDPNEEAKGKPVWFGEFGVTCKRCESKGILFGSRRPGFFPYASLCGSHDVTDVSRMIENFTHWTHAQVVLEARCGLKGNHARLAYEGMLRLRHGDDPRITGVFTVGRHMLRGAGRWVTPDRYETLSKIRGTLASLPAVQVQNGGTSAERLDMFDQTVDLSLYGYPSIRPIRGMRVFGEKLSSAVEEISVVLPPINLIGPGKELLRPKYLTAARRIPIDVAWERVESVFPGVSRKYLTLLLAARGVAEGCTGIPANIICTGPTGSGKSATCHIAASILGDTCTDVKWTDNEMRFRQHFSKSIAEGMFTCVNELFKEARRVGLSAREAMDFFLTLTPNSLSYEMYIGSVPLGQLPVTIVTDTTVPGEVKEDAQLGRRFIYVRMSERLEWQKSLITTGVSKPENFRAFSIENAEASNAIASWVIDTYFGSHPRSLEDIAHEIGYETLENSEDVIVSDPDALPDFFKAVCEAPETQSESRLKGRGWKKICRDDVDTYPLATAWAAICDGMSLEQFKASRRATEVDWSGLVNVPKRTELDVLPQGKSVAVRFRYGETRGGHYFVNDELLTCEGERREHATNV